MDTPVQTLKPPRRGIGLVWVLVLMFASFSGGVFVGLNPMQVPLPSWVPAWSGRAASSGREDVNPQGGAPARMVGEPATQPTMDTAPTTQAGPEGH